MKSVLDLNIPLEKHLDIMHWTPECKVSSVLFLQNGTSVHKCEHFMKVQGIHM